MNLKKQIEKMKADREREKKEAAEAQERKDAAEREANVAEARAIVACIPDTVKEALVKDRDSIILFEDADIPGTVDAISKGVAYELVVLLTAEGLRDRLWVDIDCSGNYLSRNALHLRI